MTREEKREKRRGDEVEESDSVDALEKEKKLKLHTFLDSLYSCPYTVRTCPCTVMNLLFSASRSLLAAMAPSFITVNMAVYSPFSVRIFNCSCIRTWEEGRGG